jgi:fatty-acyl-CoA synthase
VLGIEDERWGEVPAAAIVPADLHEARAIIDAVRSHCNTQLAGYKQPRRMIVLEEIPRTASGKAALGEIKVAMLASADTARRRT